MAKPYRRVHLVGRRICIAVLCLLATALLSTGAVGSQGAGPTGSRNPTERVGTSGGTTAASVFTDVPVTHWGHDYIEAVYQAGYVAGCSTDPLQYCPDHDLNRAEMAVFIVRGVHGADFEPPEPSEPIFADVPVDYWGAGWIHQLWNDGYTAGCGTDPDTGKPLYCPLQPHTRAEAAVFFMRMLNGVGYEPPPATGIFADVPSGQWYEGWVEAAYNAGLIPPCQIYPELRFCPDEHVSRAMAAYMMSQAKGLIMSPDIIIWGVEVTQGIQNLENDMPLVEGRQTVVRVHVYSGLLGNLYGVPAQLRVYWDDIEVHESPFLPDNDNESLTVRPGLRDRLELDGSFWFRVPSKWCLGRVEFRVEVNNDLSVPERNVENNAASVVVTFRQAEPLYLGMVRLELYDQGDPTNPCLTYDTREPGFVKLLWTLKRFHPIRTLEFYRSEDIVGPGDGNPPWNLAEEEDTLAILDAIWEADIFRDTPVEYRMGMVHPDLDARYNGRAWRPGNVAWARMVSGSGAYPDWVIRGGHTMAHELGHNKGLKHINCTGTEKHPDPNYPWPNPDPPPNCLLAPIDSRGYYGFDVYHELLGFQSPAVISNDPGALWPHQAFPLMGYERPRWISPYSYCLLLEAYGYEGGCNVSDLLATDQARMEQMLVKAPQAFADPAELRALQEATQFIAASGLVYIADRTAEFKCVYQLDAPSPSALRQAADQLGYRRVSGMQTEQSYTLVQADADGQVLDAQELYFGATGGEGQIELFLELVPLAQGTARIQVRQGEEVLAERIASANPPEVQVLEPNGGERLAPGATVRWAASDPDGDPLRFNVLCTPDDGQTWHVIRMGVLGDHFEIPSLDDLPGSEQGRIRIVAHDGFHTAHDDSDGTFSVPGSPPWVAILPPSGTFVKAGRLVAFEGLATDVDDGPLTDEQLTWHSDLDGNLGTGELLEIRTLSSGTHQITLTATDSDGEASSATIILYVGVHPLYLPVVVR